LIEWQYFQHKPALDEEEPTKIKMPVLKIC